MLDAIAAVAAFHQKLDIAHPRKFRNNKVIEVPGDFSAVLSGTEEFSDWLQSQIDVDDPRYLRMHLILEEAVEFCHACLNGSEELAFDGLIDLLYVTLGTALQFDWPLVDGFAEVHRSNMTKEKQAADPHAERVRDKGTGYLPPNIAGVLKTCSGVSSVRLLDILRHGKLPQTCYIITNKAGAALSLASGLYTFSTDPAYAMRFADTATAVMMREHAGKALGTEIELFIKPETM